MKRHELRDSVFFRLRTRKKLAARLQKSEQTIDSLTARPSLYVRRWKLKSAEVWRNEQPDPNEIDLFREIDIPDPKLKQIQSRIADLLMRVEPPVWLFSPVKGRSYVDNAAFHRGGRAFCSLDVSDYFPNCSADAVAHFFSVVMECAPDVTAIIVRLVTKDGCLPQGSPCSPILAYFSCLRMWGDVVGAAESNGVKASVYADDITLSGDKIPGELIWTIKKTIHKHGHRLKASKQFSSIDRAADITGCIVNGDTLRLPNRQHEKLFRLRQEWHRSNEAERSAIERRINGRIAQRKQVERL